MFAPHHAENPELSQGWLAPSKKLLDLFKFGGRQAVPPERLRRNSRSHRGGHGEVLLSHLGALGGKDGQRGSSDGELRWSYWPSGAFTRKENASYDPTGQGSVNLVSSKISHR